MNVVARRYARALIDTLPEDRLSAALENILHLSSIFDSTPDARRLLLHPGVPPDTRTAFIDTLARVLGFERPVRNLLAMLVDRRRLDLLEDVRIACQELSDLRTGTLRIEVTSAEPLVPAESESLARRIEETTGKRVVLEQASDPSIIGGLVVRIGGTVMDASLRQQLAGAGKRLRAE